ncbi:MAG: oligoendopeptidase F, partial [Spartobacteria bacterium]|nr:oligoendopeptidase F [Spartobacteria bacterium]
YRQTMFAEFEKMLHALDAEGVPLTPDALGERYYELNALYYGPEVKPDPLIALGWARIPHFYYNFYVYKYATSYCASQLFAARVLADTEGRDLYLDLLRGGGSDDPLLLIRQAGVDLTAPVTLESAFQSFRETVRELGDIIGPEA